MSENMQQIVALLGFALVMMFLNLNAGPEWLRSLSLGVMLASFGLAGWMIIEWVFV